MYDLKLKESKDIFENNFICFLINASEYMALSFPITILLHIKFYEIKHPTKSQFLFG